MEVALGPRIPASKTRLERTQSSGQNSSHHILLRLQNGESRESVLYTQDSLRSTYLDKLLKTLMLGLHSPHQ